MKRQRPPSRPAAVTTSFGTFEIEDDALIEFPEGLPGFERCTRYVLISSDEIAPLRCIQAVDPPRPSFLVLDPSAVIPGYRQPLGRADLARLGGGDDADLLWFAIVTVGGAKASINLRAPLVINYRRMVGCQLLPLRSRYRVDHPLALG